MPRYEVFEKVPRAYQSGLSNWNFMKEVSASSAAEAIRIVKRWRATSGTVPPGTKYKATKENSNPAKRPKLGKWIRAHRVRVVKNSAGEKVLEIQRTVKKTIRRKPARRKKR